MAFLPAIELVASDPVHLCVWGVPVKVAASRVIASVPPFLLRALFPLPLKTAFVSSILEDVDGFGETTK